MECSAFPDSTGEDGVLPLKPKVVLTLITAHPIFFLAAKIDELRTVHTLLPFRQIPFYSERFLEVKWSNCKRFLSIQWMPQSERKPAKVSPQQTETARTQLLQKTFSHHLI